MKQTGKIERNSQFSLRAFTIIELLVSLSILATISIVAYVSYSGHMKTANNATRIATIDSLHLSLSDYYQQKKTLPEPNSNYISYDPQGTYLHSLTESYGVSGYVSNNFLPSWYVNFRATDPESNQFYGYGKLTDNTAFDVAATLYDETTGGYKTYIRGTYGKQRLASLIRAYSSSNFVSEDSTENLPYNPYERKITASISAYSGSVVINPTKSLTGELNSGDIITLSTGSTALLHISDGSELSLGSTTSQTILNLTSLSYNADNNLSSKVALYLKAGEVWTEAPHLRTEADSPSDFSIQTDSAVAAVRGTVFGISQSSTGITAISLKVGKLEVEKIVMDSHGTTTTEAFTGSSGFTTSSTGWFILNSSGSYMVVPDGGAPIRLDSITNVANSAGIVLPTSTGSLDSLDIGKKIQHPPFSLGYRPMADSISFSTGATGGFTQTGILSVKLQNLGADSYYLSFGTGEIDGNTTFHDPNPFYTGVLSTSSGPVTITGAFAYIPWWNIQRTYALRICFQGECSAPDIKILGNDIFSFDNFRVWGEQKQKVVATSPALPCNADNPALPEFWTSACLVNNPGLVAYAPYDSAKDLRMYGLNNAQYLDSYGSTIIMDSCSWFTGWNCDLNFSDIGASAFDKLNSFATYSDGTKWIYINSQSSKDWMKYDLAPLTLGNKFSIEMRIRRAALNRSERTYFLYNFSGANAPYLDLHNGNLYLGYDSGSFKNIKILNWSVLPHIDDNTFVTIRTEFDGTTWKATVNGIPFTDLTYGWSAWISISGNNTLFIGSKNDATSQWNDIIDSVKIYK